MHEVRQLGLVATLLCLAGPAATQEVSEYTPERQKLVQGLVNACAKAEAITQVGKGPRATFRIDEKNLRAVLSERKKELTPELRDAVVAAWVWVAPNLKPVCVALLKGMGQETGDKRALAFAAFLRAKGEDAEQRQADAVRSYQRAVALFRELDDRPFQAISLNNLGSLLHDQGEYAKALEQHSLALKIRQDLYPKERYPHGHPDLANSLNNLGSALHAQGEYAKALEQLSVALKMFQDLYPKERYPKGHSDLAASLNNLGGALHAQGEYAKALEQHTLALKMFQDLYPKEKYPQGHPDLAASLNNLGMVLEARGEYAKALEQYSLALKMFQDLYPKEKYPKGHLDLATSLNNLGSVLHAQGEHAKALEQLSVALKMRQNLYPKERYPHGHPELARSLNKLGFVLQAQGEYAKALEQLSVALKMRQDLYPKERYPHGHPDLAISLNNLGSVLHAQGEYAKALEQYSLALKMFQDLYPKERYPQGHPHLATSLNHLGSVLHAQGEYAKALEQYSLALKIRQDLYPKERYPKGHPDLANSLNNLGSALHAQGEYAKALEQYSLALKIRQDLYPKERYPHGHSDLANSLINLGMVLEAQGEDAKALEQLSLALKMEVDLARDLAVTMSEATALNHAVSQPPTRDVLLSVSRDAAPAAVYALIWQSKASFSRVFERRQLALRTAAADPRTQAAFHRLSSLRRERGNLILALAPRTAAESNSRDQRLKQLDKDLEEAEKALAPRLPALPRSEAVARSTPDDLRKVLPEDAVLVDLLRYTHFAQDLKVKGAKGEKRTPWYVAFVLSRDGVKRVELAKAKDIEEALSLWRQAIVEATPTADASAKYAAELRTLVWDKLAAVLPKGTRTVFLSPDAALSRLPWAALPGRRDATVLLEDHALAVVPHGVFLLDQLTAPVEAGKVAPELLLALGGVAYDDAPAEASPEVLLTGLDLSRAGVVGAGKKLWAALPGTSKELERVRALAGERLKVRTLTGKEAGIEQVRALLPKARIAHFATHGFFADPSFRSRLQIDEKLFAHRTFVTGGTAERIGTGARSPLVLSGLVLAGANRKETPDRGILSADSVVSLPLQGLELAVLSACESGLGETAGGEGVFGLQRAFHLAGTKNVVASLWKVDDLATAALLGEFYRQLWEEKQPPIEALRQAQLAVYRADPKRFREMAARGIGVGSKDLKDVPVLRTERKDARAGNPPVLWAAFTLSGLGR